MPNPDPIFCPWDEQALRMTVRHHLDRSTIAQILQSADGFRLTWMHNRIPDSLHTTGLEAAGAVAKHYGDYLKIEEEELREFTEREKYEERFIRRRASTAARAIRIPYGGQPT